MCILVKTNKCNKKNKSWKLALMLECKNCVRRKHWCCITVLSMWYVTTALSCSLAHISLNINIYICKKIILAFATIWGYFQLAFMQYFPFWRIEQKLIKLIIPEQRNYTKASSIVSDKSIAKNQFFFYITHFKCVTFPGRDCKTDAFITDTFRQ